MSKARCISSTHPSRKNYCAAKKCSGHDQQSCPLSFHHRYNARGDTVGFVDKNGNLCDELISEFSTPLVPSVMELKDVERILREIDARMEKYLR